MVTTLDTLRFSRTLQAAGIPKEQLEAQATAFADVLQSNFQELVTRELWATTTTELNHKIDSSRSELENKIDGVEQRLLAKIDSVEQRLDSRITGVEQRLEAKIDLAVAKLSGEMILLKWMMGVSVTLMVTALVRLFFYHTTTP